MMPRPKMAAPSQIRLLEQLSLGAVIKTYPMATIETILDQTGCNSIRRRLLPSYIIVYLTIVLALYADVSIRETLRIILDELRTRFGHDAIKIGVSSAITKARQRVGAYPLQVLFEQVVQPVNNPQLKGCYWRGKLLVAVDGNCIEVQNTKKNRGYFGTHTNQHGPTGYPILKWVGLGECGTHIIFACQVGSIFNDEKALFTHLISKLQPDMLLLADRLYYSYHLWKKCIDTGCSLLWRVQKGISLKPLTYLSDGSYLAEIRPSDKLIHKGLGQKNEKMTVRVVCYNVTFEDGSESEPIRLITNLLDSEEAPAEELALLYADRWAIETGFDEFKTHLKGSPRILRSQLPTLVLQEFYGFLLAYNLVRKVMADAALMGDMPPGELSFVHSVRVIKRRLTVSFFPSGDDTDDKTNFLS